MNLYLIISILGQFVRAYLKHKFGLSDNENKFINSFIDILHVGGGYDFVSEKEYFRLARNIAIELSLFLLSKYEKIIKEK